MTKKRILALLLVIFTLFCNISVVTYAEDAVYVLAASDFQARSSDVPEQNEVEGIGYMTNILNKMESVGGYTTFDGFLFCGDYTQTSDVKYSSSGLAKMDELITTRYPECENRIYIQGNHDSANTVGLSPSGANDTENYGVFVIHEDDFPHNQADSNALAATQKTAASLKTYLKAKLDENYKKPIFIVSHLPLHYNRRTPEKNNAIYGNLLYDIIDEAAEYGLNIVYMFGHNHSSTYDNYLGDYAIYLEPGDEIIVPQGSAVKTRVEELHFMYLNAGYVGYTASRNTNELTMTAFKIEGDKITVERYNGAGRYNLKVAGKADTAHNVTTPIDSKVYESPRTMSLNRSQEEWGVEWKYATDSGCYLEKNEVKGVVRFLFLADNTRGRVKEEGIVYLNANGEEITKSSTGRDTVFYSQIVNIPENSKDRYYAKAYCTVESSIYDGKEQTFWSDIVDCDVDYSKLLTVTK